MIIELKKFGTTLISRQTGREALAAFLPNLKDLQDDEEIVIDFDGVKTFSPSWGDEFLTELQKKYVNRLKLGKTENLSVKATVKILEQTNGIKFTTVK